MATLIKSMGFLLSLCPFFVLEGATNFLGRLFVGIPSGRRRVLLSNLRHAFPERSEDELLSAARESAARMFEMGFFSLCYPFLGKDKLRKSVTYTKHAEKTLSRMRISGQPYVIMIPHVCLFETLATSPHFRPQGNRRLGAIYRPNKNQALDEWINSARQDVGIVTFSRKAGFTQTKEFLRKGNWLAILFDQNAGNQGTLSFFLDRIASVTTLPDLLAKGTKARSVYACPRRTGFFQSSVDIVELDTSKSISFGAHDLLADQIKSHPRGFPDWLWPHSKWKIQYYPEVKFSLDAKRKLFPKKLPRKLLFFVRMPNWLGDVMMAIPILLAMTRARPDAKFVLICQPQFRELLEFLKIGDEIMPTVDVFSPSGMKACFGMRKRFADCHFLFTNSLRGDFEAFLMGATHRFGLRRPGKPRPLLSHSFRADKEMLEGEKALHQTTLWRKAACRFGLAIPVEFNPLLTKTVAPSPGKLGIVLGSSNNPAKRWSRENWAELCELFLKSANSIRVSLYGTRQDLEDAAQIVSELGSERVRKLAGKTNLRDLALEFSSCSMIIGCDSGGVHLANAVGTRTAVLFGPTNQQVTKPCYASPLLIIQPEDPAGGEVLEMSSIAPSAVFSKCKSFLNEQ